MEALLPIDKLTTFAGIFFGVCVLVIAAILLDLWDGVITARRTGLRVHSHKLRVTIAKMSEYWRFVLIGFLVDCLGSPFGFYGLPVLSMLFGAGLIIVEAKSMFEHARRRKSHTAKLPDIVKDIVRCAHENDAQKIIETLTAMTVNKPEPATAASDAV